MFNSMRALFVFIAVVVATPAQQQLPQNQGINNVITPQTIKNNKEIPTIGRIENVATIHESSGIVKEPKDERNVAVRVEQPKVLLRHPHAVLFGRTCGGTIISPTWVITAGHCTIFTSGRYVLAGTSRSDDDSGVLVRVKRLVIHPRFSVGPYFLDPERFNISQVAAHYDFLLAELEEPLKIDNRTIKAAILDDELTTPVAVNVSYAGYGADHHGGVMRHEMHEMEMTVLSDDTCNNRFVEYEAGDMLCAVGRPPRFDSACNGDSGSGLVTESGRLVGVASWVEGDARGCRNGAIVIFSRIARARHWIHQVTGL